MILKWLAVGISTVSMILLILASLTNVIGYQTVQSSNHSVIKERIDQKELLFQTIVDIVNNKEIQRIILKSQISRGVFPYPDIKFPVLTKNQLRQMYLFSLVLSKFISKSRIQSKVGDYQFSNQEMQKEINTFIEKNPAFKGEIAQLSHSECDCENENTTNRTYPVLCMVLFLLLIFSLFIGTFITGYGTLSLFIVIIGSIYGCFWY